MLRLILAPYVSLLGPTQRLLHLSSHALELVSNFRSDGSRMVCKLTSSSSHVVASVSHSFPDRNAFFSFRCSSISPSLRRSAAVVTAPLPNLSRLKSFTALAAASLCVEVSASSSTGKRTPSMADA